MPAPDESPAPRLTLASFDGPDAPPDNYVMPPSKGGQASPAQDAPPQKSQPEPDIKPVAEEVDDAGNDGDDTPPDAEPKKAKESDEPPQTLDDVMEDPVVTAKKESAAKAEADKKAAEDAAAAEKAKSEGKTTPEVERDSDLKVEHGAHTHPKTRKLITEFQAKAKAARDERDSVAAKLAEAEKRAKDAEEKAKSVTVPESTEKELKELRERVRELDITKDPVIQQKYDTKIEGNNKSILDVLKANGLGKVKRGEDYVDDPSIVAKVVKEGLTLKNLQPYIKSLEDGGLIDEADAIRESVRENNRIARDKQAEIESWKGDYSKRQQERAEITKQQTERQQKAYREQTDLQLKADLAELEKSFPHLKEPPAPLPTDIPATVKAKQAAIDEWAAARKQVEAAVKGFNPEGVPVEKMPEVVGRINAAAIQAAVLKVHVLPRLTKENAALSARAKELEAELARIKDAGKLSRAQAGASPEPGAGAQKQFATLADAFVDPNGG